MNKTEKAAWFTLGTAVLLLAFFIYVFVELFLNRQLPVRRLYLWSAGTFAYMIFSIFWIFGKRPLKEIQSDERDVQIQKNAAVFAFVAILLLNLIGSSVPGYIVGPAGQIGVYFLPLINFAICLMGFGLYSAAILVQYHRGGTDE